MNAGTAPAPKASKSKELAETEADLKCEAAAIEKLRVQLSAQGASADKKQVAEFAKRQKAYLDRKIEFEKLKRSTDNGTPEPASAQAATQAPAQKQKARPEKPAPAPREKTPFAEPAKPPKSETPRAKEPTRSANKSSSHCVWWLLLAAAAGLVAWLMR